MDDVLIQNKYGEYRPLENKKVKASDETQLVYANGFLKAVNDAIINCTMTKIIICSWTSWERKNNDAPFKNAA